MRDIFDEGQILGNRLIINDQARFYYVICENIKQNRLIENNQIYLQQSRGMKKNLHFDRALGIAMIVCRNPITKKFLVMQQTDGTWWIPGGRVEAPQGFIEAGIRQCKQQAGIDVTIKGVLRMQHNISSQFLRLKSILYAEPIDPQQKPKQQPDQESLQGKYMSIQQILSIKSQWRQESIYVWPKYIQENGKVYPVPILKEVYQK